MNTRLAQIIAQSIGPDGTPDRAKIFDALRISPDDPVAVIVDGVLGAQVAHAAHLDDLRVMLESHADRVRASAQSVEDHLVAVEAARTKAEAAIKTEGDGLAKHAHTIVQAVQRVVTAAEAFGNRAIITVFFIGMLAGAGLAAGFIYWILKR